jgi:hypothetical protein
MDKDQRREIGAHYTSEENILKLINPLFMDGLRAEFDAAKKRASYQGLADIHEKIAGIRFLDPACGCGNFLMIAYRELRRLELDIVRAKRAMRGGEAKRQKGITKHTKGVDHSHLDMGAEFRVAIEQFGGIEVLPWPCQLARTGMWLMDHLMNMEASDELGQPYSRLPLTEGASIAEGNALQMDWEDVVPKGELSYILGNPPFVGYAYRTEAQHSDMDTIFGNQVRGHMDYVAAWFKKASAHILGTGIRAAFVATNSITQGEQAVRIWKPLFADGIRMDFAHRTFKWTNEARGKAAVHCVIVGFSHLGLKAEKVIFDGGRGTVVEQINPYLVAAPPVFVEPRGKPLCDAQAMCMGNMPRDGGHLILSEEEREMLIEAEPNAKKYIRRYYMGDDFINDIKRWCLWLADCPPSELKRMPLVLQRVERVRRMRMESRAASTRQKAGAPALFGQMGSMANGSDYLAVPKVSSERRDYIPMGFLGADTVPGDKLFVLPNASLYHFGVLTSSAHNAWARAVCGRLKSDYSYSSTIVYNNFPWPEAGEKQKAEIERLARGILDAREMFPGASLADLYDPLTMPKELLGAHKALDRAVMKLYGFKKGAAEADMVAALMERHQRLVSPKK